MSHYAPGARVEVRDAEWVIRRVDLSSDKGYQLTCDGISELVRGKTAIFPSQLEDDIKILDPATTDLIQDTSDAFQQTLLNIESQLRQATANDAAVTLEYPNGTAETKLLGWEDICPAPAPIENGRRIDYASGQSYGRAKIPDGTKIHRTVKDDTLPGGPREKIITYVASFYLPDREEDYRVAWDVFIERFKDNH